MKKLLSLILAGAMLFSLAACTDSSDDKDDDNNKRNKFNTVENIDGENGGFADGEKDFADEDFNGTQVGDYITFGSYEQDNDLSNGKEPIEWLVLDEKDGKVLVVSKCSLDSKWYNESKDEVTWETCTLRSWLNDEFINEAFTISEKAKIPTVTVTADKNPSYDTDPGSDTQDKVFLLSIDEANKYFKSEESRICKVTDYAVAQGAETKDSGSYIGNCWWLLRTPGKSHTYTASVLVGGGVYEFGEGVATNGCAIRPAMWIEL